MELSRLIYLGIGIFGSAIIVRSITVWIYENSTIDIESVGDLGFLIGMLIFGIGYYYTQYHACRTKAKSWEMTSQFMADNEPYIHHKKEKEDTPKDGKKSEK